MLRTTVVSVKPKGNYMLELAFDNHEMKKFDVKPISKGHGIVILRILPIFVL